MRSLFTNKILGNALETKFALSVLRDIAEQVLKRCIVLGV
jgi:hypothetical protein